MISVWFLSLTRSLCVFYIWCVSVCSCFREGGCFEAKMKNRVLHLKTHSSERFFGLDSDKMQDFIIPFKLVQCYWEHLADCREIDLLLTFAACVLKIQRNNMLYCETWCTVRKVSAVCNVDECMHKVDVHWEANNLGSVTIYLLAFKSAAIVPLRVTEVVH